MTTLVRSLAVYIIMFIRYPIMPIQDIYPREIKAYASKKVKWIFKPNDICFKMNIISSNSYGIKFKHSVSLNTYSVVSVIFVKIL